MTKHTISAIALLAALALPAAATAQDVTAGAGAGASAGASTGDGGTSVNAGADASASASAGVDNGTSSTPTKLGQLQLYRFANKEGLESIGDNNFVETPSSGAAQAGTPNTDGMGKVMQGYLEEANVNSVTEIADLIAAQRAYEMNARVISGADEMLSSVSQLR